MKVVALLLLLTVLAGILVPYIADKGVGPFRNDPILYRVAVNARQSYWRINRDPVAKVVAPEARVTRVWRDAGHCHDTRANGETAEYRAEVRGIGWFGLPGPTVDVSCGGLQWRRRQ